MPTMAEPRRQSCVQRTRVVVSMATTVRAEVVVDEAASAEAVDEALVRALGWFAAVESTCSRFAPGSELSRLTAEPGQPRHVSSMLFEAVRYACAVAEATEGVFDPTLGATLVGRGFDREHRSGRRIALAIGADSRATYRDVRCDVDAGTITLARPLILDLGAVAKGLAIDLAARELAPFRNFAIDAGGDLYLSGVNRFLEPWAVGIRHPNGEGSLIEQVRISGAAFCTSGNYERPGHLIEAHSASGAEERASSVSVKAPSALVADALSTAAFCLGPVAGRRFLASQGVAAILYDASFVRSTVGTV